MAPTVRFTHHPGAKEAPAHALVFKDAEDKNPVLRGFLMQIVGTLVGNSPFLQRTLYANAGLGIPGTIPGLAKEKFRFDPTVIPTLDGRPEDAQLGFGPELAEPRPADLAGRFYSVADYHALYRSGQVTPLQVAEALLPLIRRDGPTPSRYAVAWISVDHDMVLAAATASTERWAAGKPLGLLDGVPFGVKDEIDVKGYATTFGMKTDAADRLFTPAARTVWPVRTLEEAGAVMMGKMNMSECGLDTAGCNPCTGTPTNWYNKSFYPGGSSSGAGSALCGGVIPIAVGTDSGCSVRIPAAFCGVYGLKTSQGRTCTANSSLYIIGPMAATVSDLVIAYRTMARPDPEDPTQRLFAPSVPATPSAEKYLGVCREWVAKSDPDVLVTFQSALDHLASPAGGGYEIVDIALPFLREGQLAHAAVVLTEAADQAQERSADPARPTPALSAPSRTLLAVGSQTPASDYLRCAQLRQVVMAHLASLWARHPGLLVVTPTSSEAGWPVHPGDQAYGLSDGNRNNRALRYSWLASLSGCPAVSCPVGYVDPAQGEGRLPVGLMAMGEWGAEEQLLGFARDTEAYLEEDYPGGRLRPREWVDVIAMAKGETESEENGS